MKPQEGFSRRGRTGQGEGEGGGTGGEAGLVAARNLLMPSQATDNYSGTY